MIYNKTRKKILVREHECFFSPLRKAIGLMFHTQLKDEGLVFCFDTEKKRSIHMWFVLFSIDVLFLDKHKRIVEVKKFLTPFTFYFPKQKAQYVIELPKGILTQTNTMIGDRVRFKC